MTLGWGIAEPKSQRTAQTPCSWKTRQSDVGANRAVGRNRRYKPEATELLILLIKTGFRTLVGGLWLHVLKGSKMVLLSKPSMIFYNPESIASSCGISIIRTCPQAGRSIFSKKLNLASLSRAMTSLGRPLGRSLSIQQPWRWCLGPTRLSYHFKNFMIACYENTAWSGLKPMLMNWSGLMP